MKVSGSAYDSQFNWINSDCVAFDRCHQWPINTEQIDVFGQMWSIALIEGHGDEISIRVGNRFSQLNGQRLILIPPNTIIHWRLRIAQLRWTGLFFNHPIVKGLPRHAAFCIRPSNMTVEAVTADPIATLASIQKWYGLDTTIPPIAAKIKKLLDRTFDEPHALTEIAQNLNLHPSVMARTFKKTFALTPVSYRNQLRLAESQRLLLFCHHNVATAAHRCGFADLSRYNKQFQHFHGTTPSQFKSIAENQPLFIASA